MLFQLLVIKVLREHILIRQELIFAGVVVSSEDATIKAGDQVIVTDMT